MSGLFPSATSRAISSRETCVMLDMDDYSIPDSLCPYLIQKKIKTTMFDAGYKGTVSVRIWVTENIWSDDLQERFQYEGLSVRTIPQGDKDLRYKMFLVDLIFSAWLLCGTSNILILSKNHENMEQDSRFSRFRKALEKNGHCLVTATPETLINEGIIEEEKNGMLRDHFRG